MKRLLFWHCVFVLVSCGAAAQTQESAADTQRRSEKNNIDAALYKTLEGRFRSLITEFQKQYPVPAGTDEKTADLAMQGVEFLLYNQAYYAYSCLKLFGPNADKDKYEKCVSDSNARQIKYTKIADYVMTIPPQVHLRCEMKSRLFDAEDEFPPFAFFRWKHKLHLFDFEKLNNCYLNNAH
jgi:hypothetical protein